MQRKILLVLAALVTIAGIAWLGAALSRPSTHVAQAMARVPLTEPLASGSFRFVPDPLYAQNKLPLGILLVRHANGRLDAWSLVVKEGVPHMPDRTWWRSGFPCPGFAPDFAAGVFACPAASLPLWAGTAADFRWSLDGRYLGTRSDMPAMQRRAVMEQGDRLLVGLMNNSTPP